MKLLTQSLSSNWGWSYASLILKRLMSMWLWSFSSTYSKGWVLLRDGAGWLRDVFYSFFFFFAISSFFFIMIMEALNWVFLILLCLIIYSRVGGGQRRLEKRDQTSLVCRWYPSFFTNLREKVNIRCILIYFEVVSSLTVNFDVTKMVSLQEDVPVHDLDGLLRSKLSVLPTKYLWIPFGADRKDLRVWDPIILKMEKGPFAWKRSSLSKCRILILVRDTGKISNLFFFVFPSLFKVTNRLEAIQYRFIWNNIENHREYHLVAWDTVKR